MKNMRVLLVFSLIICLDSCMPAKPPIQVFGKVNIDFTDLYAIVNIKVESNPENYDFYDLVLYYMNNSSYKGNYKILYRQDIINTTIKDNSITLYFDKSYFNAIHGFVVSFTDNNSKYFDFHLNEYTRVNTNRAPIKLMKLPVGRPH